MSDIPILICSPFASMHRERDALHRLVLPELRELARKDDRDVRDVDLQWGRSTTPEATAGFLEIVASELSRASILIALLNGEAGFEEEPDDRIVRTLQIYVALMSRSTRVLAFLRHGERSMSADVGPAESSSDFELADRMRERGASITLYSSLDGFPTLVLGQVLPIVHGLYLDKVGTVFVSYSGRDDGRVRAIVDGLRRARFVVWIDEADIPGGRSWRAEIAKAVTECHVVLFLISPASVASEPCLEEIALARSRKKPVLSVFLETVELPAELELMLSRFQHVAYQADGAAKPFVETLGNTLKGLIDESRSRAG
jgi:hypothetical protein